MWWPIYERLLKKPAAEERQKDGGRWGMTSSMTGLFDVYVSLRPWPRRDKGGLFCLVIAEFNRRLFIFSLLLSMTGWCFWSKNASLISG